MTTVGCRKLGKLATALAPPVRSSSMTYRAELARSHPNLVPRWLNSLWDSHPLVVVTGVVVVALAVAVGLLWPLTDAIAAHDVGLIAGPKRAPALQSAREAARTQLLTLGAGAFCCRRTVVYRAKLPPVPRRARCYRGRCDPLPRRATDRHRQDDDHPHPSGRRPTECCRRPRYVMTSLYSCPQRSGARVSR
jgi:hypothetical protein